MHPAAHCGACMRAPRRAGRRLRAVALISSALCSLQVGQVLISGVKERSGENEGGGPEASVRSGEGDTEAGHKATDAEGDAEEMMEARRHARALQRRPCCFAGACLAWLPSMLLEGGMCVCVCVGGRGVAPPGSQAASVRAEGCTGRGPPRSVCGRPEPHCGECFFSSADAVSASVRPQLEEVPDTGGFRRGLWHVHRQSSAVNLAAMSRLGNGELKRMQADIRGLQEENRKLETQLEEARSGEAEARALAEKLRADLEAQRLVVQSRLTQVGGGGSFFPMRRPFSPLFFLSLFWGGGAPRWGWPIKSR
jgi:hypothetical protein